MRIEMSNKEKVLSIVLVAMVIVFYAMPTKEYVPEAQPLSGLAKDIGPWQTVSDSKPDQEILDLLRADDTLSRVYRKSDGNTVSLFLAFFKSQRAGVSPHSPKVCLPGSGWLPERSDRVALNVPDTNGPITVNRYIVSRGEYKSLVLYWYQSPHRIIADEYAAKFWLVLDGVRYRRSDTSLVRVIVPFSGGSEENAFREAQEFIRASFPLIKGQLPS